MQRLFVAALPLALACPGTSFQGKKRWTRTRHPWMNPWPFARRRQVMPALSELSRWGTCWDGGTQRLHQVAKFYEEEKELFNSLNSVWSSESLLTLPVTKDF